MGTSWPLQPSEELVMQLPLLNQGGLWCFSRPFWKEKNFQNIEKFIVICNIIVIIIIIIVLQYRASMKFKKH